MDNGKEICKILKEIRQRIAEENDIELITSECTYKGDCQGTCPKCEAELRYLEQELERQQKGLSSFFGEPIDDILSSMPHNTSQLMQGAMSWRPQTMKPLMDFPPSISGNSPEDQ